MCLAASRFCIPNRHPAFPAVHAVDAGGAPPSRGFPLADLLSWPPSSTDAAKHIIYLFVLPVRRGAMLPTFLPGGAFLDAWVGLPFVWEPLPPNGWATAFMEMPETMG